MFEVILRALVEEVPGARGVVFCDREGEMVQAVGASGRDAPEAAADYDLMVAGAQLATPLDLAEAHSGATLGSVRECVIAGERETLVVRTLPDGYYLVLCLRPGALVSRALHHLRLAAERVRQEM